MEYSQVFKMEEETDDNAVLSISLGAVSGKQIDKKHTIFIDNIVIEEVDPNSEKER